MADLTEIGALIGEDIKKLNKDRKLLDESDFSAYGYTKRTNKANRWLEGDTPNIIVDKIADSVRFSDGLQETIGEELISVNGDFGYGDDGSWALSEEWMIHEGYAELTGIQPAVEYLSYIPKTIPANSYVKITYSIFEVSEGWIQGMVEGISGETRYEDGIYEDIIMSEADGLISLMASSDFVGKVKFVSAKYIPQVELPIAPFASTSTDELLDDKINGVTTQVAHSKGDIVVSGNELVTNGTFDTDTDWEKGVDHTISGGVLNIDTAASSSTSQVQNAIIGKTYIYSAYISCTKGSIKFEPYASDIAISEIVTEGFSKYVSIVVTIASSTAPLAIWGVGATTGTVDNVSVVAIDDIHQATTDTLAGDLTTDTTKFQVLDYVTRKDIIVLTKTGYKTIKGIHAFEPNCSNDTIANTYSWSKLGNGLYHNGTEEVVIVGYQDRLNAGAYHPVYNIFGTAQYIEDDAIIYRWYQVQYQATTYNSFIKAGPLVSIGYRENSGYLTSGGLGDARPDGKFYDKIYYESNGGLIFKPSYTTKSSEYDLLNYEFDKLIGGNSEMAEIAGVEVYSEIMIGSSGTYSTLDFGRDMIELEGTFPFYIRLASGDIAIVIDFYTGTKEIILLDRAVNRTALERIYFTRTNNSLTIQGKALSTDIIGNPLQYVIGDALYTSPTSVSITDIPIDTLVWDEATGIMYKTLVATNDLDASGLPIPLFTDITAWEQVQKGYPQDWLNKLASGKAIGFNSLLVNQDGTSAIPDNITTLTYTWSNKTLIDVARIFTEDAGSIYAPVTLTGDLSFAFGINDPISNNVTGVEPAERVSLFQYISLNTPLTQNTPLPVQLLQPKVIASNSHNWNKGAGITNAVTGKVSIGNGTRVLESKLLENGEISGKELLSGIEQNFYENEIFYINNTIFTNATSYFYKFIGLDSIFTSDPTWTFDDSLYWEKSASFQSIPEHSTSTLDNIDGPSAKAFASLALDTNDEYVIQVNGEELIWDFTADSPTDFIVVDGSASISYTAGITYWIALGDAHAIKSCTFTFTGIYSDLTELSNGNIVPSDGTIYFENWNGNGFGDDGAFKQLTNGTLTDLNGNTIKTFNGITRTGCYKGDK